MTIADEALASPSAARNRGPILDMLRGVLPSCGTVLEIASGTGEHAVHVAAACPHLVWQPTDPEPSALRSISAHRALARLPNLLAPLELDVRQTPWASERADAVVAINMIHIAPWAATIGLMAGAGRALPPGGILFLYGPFIEEDRELAASNAAFDADLRARNPDWGVRRLSRVTAVAAGENLRLLDRREMPANNLGLVFVRDAPGESVRRSA